MPKAELSPSEFYLFALEVYVPLALLLSMLCYRSCPQSQQKVPAGKVKKPKGEKKTNELKIPEGMAAYCRYCESFLMDDEQLKRHQIGKKHTANAAGATASFEFVKHEKAEQSGQSMNLQATVDDRRGDDSEWQTVEMERKKKKPARKQK